MTKDFSAGSPLFNILLKDIKRKVGHSLTYLGVTTGRKGKWIEWKANGDRYRTEHSIPEEINLEYFTVLENNIRKTLEDGRERDRE